MPSFFLPSVGSIDFDRRRADAVADLIVHRVIEAARPMRPRNIWKGRPLPAYPAWPGSMRFAPATRRAGQATCWSG